MITSERIDRACLEFEDAWRAGQTPQISDFLADWQGTDRASLLKELLLLEVDYVRRSGREPEADEYLSRFPDDRATVLAVFGIPAPPTPHFTPGQQIGRFVIERQIGEGSFATVYQAWDTQLQRMVALKVPRIDKFDTPESIDRIVEEARTAAQLDHPAIVPVLDVLRNRSDLPLIVMQYIEGCSLRDRILKEPYSLVEAVELLIQVADALEHAHQRGFVHRDLDPRNILLDTAGKPHITDFGLALHESTQHAKAGESAGSLAYMSPEQLRGDSHWLDGRSDIWALGVILYELLTGRRPFTGRTFDELASEIFARDPKPVRQINSTIPLQLEQICQTCLAKLASGRYATAGDLAAALREVIAPPKPAEVPPASAATHVPSPRAFSISTRFAATVLFSVSALPLLLFSLTASPFRPQNETAPQVRDIELSVWSSSDQYRGRINRSTGSGAPLRTGDKIRLTVTLDSPAFLYILWIGVEGEVIPIYPWTSGDWARPPAESLVNSVDIPNNPAVAWQVQPGGTGMEAVVAIATAKPIPREISLKELLTKSHAQFGKTSAEPLWFDNGQLISSDVSSSRSVNVTHTLPIQDPVVLNQLLVAERVRLFSGTYKAVCFPVLGDM